MKLRRYLGGATLGVAAILAVCAVLAALTSGTFFNDAEGAGSIGGDADDTGIHALGDPSPSTSPQKGETPDEGCCQPPDFETPSPEPEPTDIPPTEEPEPQPTQAVPTSTPSGSAGGEGIGPPDTGSGPTQDSQGWMLIATLLAIGAAVLGAAGVLTLKRAD